MRWNDGWFRGTAAAFQVQVRGDSPGQWLLTCAHNIVAQSSKGGGYAEEAAFFPGYNQRTQPPQAPQGGILTDRCYYPTAYRDGNDPTWDVALIRLRTAISPVPQALFRLIQVESFPGPFAAILAGYPGNRYGELCSEEDDVTPSSGGNAPSAVAFTHDTWTGNSGSPVFYRAEGGTYAQFAVHVAGPGPDAPPHDNIRVGILLTPAIHQWLARALSSEGQGFLNPVP
jgi:V8-like Glu-specific endopeptidase